VELFHIAACYRFWLCLLLSPAAKYEQRGVCCSTVILAPKLLKVPVHNCNTASTCYLSLKQTLIRARTVELKCSYKLVWLAQHPRRGVCIFFLIPSIVSSSSNSRCRRGIFDVMRLALIPRRSCTNFPRIYLLFNFCCTYPVVQQEDKLTIQRRISTWLLYRARSVIDSYFISIPYIRSILVVYSTLDLFTKLSNEINYPRGGIVGMLPASGPEHILPRGLERS